ncbi:MAG TPA: GH3 auxin-responsive promoter family protein, partial [Flavisolibacter sp.]|nr:GH3 auxin-responsive promoter family protein [Flavisolibacter sp.]
DQLIKKIDEHLSQLNDDYAVERTSALKQVFIEILPEQAFLKFMETKGKLGSQHKFPRVLKGKIWQEWNEFLNMNYENK